jgi:diguanylate cyclase (GGDEF)-like protein
VKARLPAAIHSQVARRLFALFVLSAFLPLAIIATVSLAQVRDLLLQQGDQRLSATAKTYGMGVFDRLTAARDVLAAIAANPATATGPLGERMFRAIATEDRSGRRTPITGVVDMAPLHAGLWARLSRGQPAVVTRGGEQTGAVLMMVPGPQGEAWIGQMRPRYLWGAFDELPASTDFCLVEDSTRSVLFCQAPGGSGELRAYAEHATEGGQTATWLREAEPHRGRAWALFMAAAFDTNDWLVVASQPESMALARLLELRRVYIPAVLLALVLVTWFTLRQSSSIVEPLGRLAQRAREVANGRFGGSLGMKRNDEFGELANAFDAMSERLGRQFASLKGLSEIDSLILNNQDTTQVVRTVVQRLSEATTAEIVTLTLYDADDRSSARTYYIGEDEDRVFTLDRHRAPAGEIEKLPIDASWQGLPAPEPTPTYLLHPAYPGLRGAFVQPIIWREMRYGVIVLGYRGQEQPVPEEMQHIREMADRMAVAVSSMWRDEQIYQRTHFDPLTGAPNRLLFTDRLGVEILRSGREGKGFAVLMVDLDHFKNVNDSFGHSMGDAVLREAAARIRRRIRTTDTLARLGGDEFAVLVSNLQHPQEAWQIAEAIVSEMAREFVVGEQHAFLSASVGIASFPADGSSAEDLLKGADTAVHRAKDEGRSQAVFFEERMNEEMVARVTLDRDLRGAMDRGELRIHYQPQVDVLTGRVIAAEALLRWFHPTRGLIPPTRFIPLAEESGFIDPLGQWIFEQVCAQMARWRDEGLSLEYVGVNVSPRQFRRRNLVDIIAACRRASGLPASAIQIEITEGLLLDRGSAVEGMLRQLAEAGHSIALDDFGTGFSSLSYLERLPVDTIKIDQSFVRNLEQGGDSKAIVAAIIAMSEALGKKIVAEGVETDGQLRMLRELGCERIQGFLISPAVDAAAFEQLAVQVSTVKTLSVG